MAAEPPGLQRRSYLDLLRGIAVLLMIDAHLFDSWTRFPDRETAAFGRAMLFGGMGTTLFLTLAGVAVALSAGSKLRRTGSPAAASAAVARRGLEIFLLAFVFRFQAWMLGWSHSSSAYSSSVNNRDRMRKRNPVGPSSEKPAPRPGTMSMVRWVCRQ